MTHPLLPLLLRLLPLSKSQHPLLLKKVNPPSIGQTIMMKNPHLHLHLPKRQNQPIHLQELNLPKLHLTKSKLRPERNQHRQMVKGKVEVVEVEEEVDLQVANDEVVVEMVRMVHRVRQLLDKLVYLYLLNRRVCRVEDLIKLV